MKMQDLLFKEEEEKLLTLFHDLCLDLLWGFHLLFNVTLGNTGR